MSVMVKERTVPKMAARPKVLSEKLALAAALAEDNGGLLPRSWAIIQQGYGDLYQYMRRHRHHFEGFEKEASIKREPSFNGTIRNKHIAAATEHYKNLGYIPEPKSLEDTKLASYMRRYPEVFEKLGKRLNRLRLRKPSRRYRVKNINGKVRTKG